MNILPQAPAIFAWPGASSVVPTPSVPVSSLTAIAAQTFYTEAADPNGVITATRPALCYAGNNTLWKKTGPGTNDTGWEPIIGQPA